MVRRPRYKKDVDLEVHFVCPSARRNVLISAKKTEKNVGPTGQHPFVSRTLTQSNI